MKKLLLFPDIYNSPSLTSTSGCTCNELIWEMGQPLSSLEYDFSNLEFICETLPASGITDFSATDSGAPVVSEKLKNIFDGFNVQAQYFPVSIFEGSGQEPKDGYYAMNIVGVAECIDFAKSDIKVKEKNGQIWRIIDIGTLVLQERSFGDMYRLSMFERVIVLKGDLAQRLKELNISGMKLIEPELWDGVVSEKEWG